MSIPIKEITISLEVPATPLSKREIKQLETALIIGTMFRPDVIQSIMSGEEITTWIDSLAVAAAALAMDKAGYPVSRIAEELGRTEATIRKHLKGETKAGKLVRETYEMLIRGELKLAIPVLESAKPEEVSKLSKEVEELKKENASLKEKLENIKNVLKQLEEALNSLSGGVEKAKKTIDEIKKYLV